MGRINIAIADDHQLIIQGYTSFFKCFPEINLIGTAGNGQELLKLVRNTLPDVILLDLRMPLMDGYEVLQILNNEYPKIKAIIVSFYDASQVDLVFIAAKASGFISKSCDTDLLIQMIHKIYKFSDVFCTVVDNQLCIKKPLDSERIHSKNILSPRELEILSLICEQYSNKLIASELNLSIKTVDFHKANIYRKTKTFTPAGLVLYALNEGILPNAIRKI